MVFTNKNTYKLEIHHPIYTIGVLNSRSK